jgi:hypothetical protein
VNIGANAPNTIKAPSGSISTVLSLVGHHQAAIVLRERQAASLKKAKVEFVVGLIDLTGLKAVSIYNLSSG